MPAAWRALAGLGLLVCGAAGPADAPPGVSVDGGGAVKVMSAEDLAQLPAVKLSVSFGTEHGPREATFEGPLLWSVLTQGGAVSPEDPRQQVRRTVHITGRDGYTAVLALGEIGPDFEGKQVILAERMDGKPLDAVHLRVVVPGDKRGGRSVRDVAMLHVE